MTLEVSSLADLSWVLWIQESKLLQSADELSHLWTNTVVLRQVIGVEVCH